MWNESLELHSTRRLEQNYSVTLESGLELRPEVFDIRCGYHSLALALLLERRHKLSNAGDDVGTRRQRETSDVRMTLLRCRPELPHRSKDDYPLPSATCSLQELDGGPGRP